ncbi:TM2 domain-containing protein [Helicobacter sp. 23-1044]
MDNISVFLMSIKGKIPSESLVPLQEKLEKVGENALQKLMLVVLKSPVVGIVLSILFGILGVDRFYKGDLKLGFAKLGLIIISYTILFVVLIVAAVATENTFMMSDDDVVDMIIEQYFLPFVLAIIGIVVAYIWWIVDIFLVFFGIKKDNLSKIHSALQ